ncbi:hypothetical protein [Streptomyces sp. rh34]|uniref:hypothetical protein n=1 Tax=Streptomyces sp. rh34 TaxID=2034272 RepID=UPI00359C5315
MSLRRLGFLSAALLTAAALTACSTEPVEADDPKPSANGTTAPSGAPGGAPDEGGLALADAIRKIPVAEEQRTGYERDAFKHWVDEDDDGCPTRQEVLLAEAVTARSRVPGARSAEAAGCPTTTRPRSPMRGATATPQAATSRPDHRLRSSADPKDNRHPRSERRTRPRGRVAILGRPGGRPPRRRPLIR